MSHWQFQQFRTDNRGNSTLAYDNLKSLFDNESSWHHSTKSIKLATNSNSRNNNKRKRDDQGDRQIAGELSANELTIHQQVGLQNETTFKMTFANWQANFFLINSSIRFEICRRKSISYNKFQPSFWN